MDLVDSVFWDTVTVTVAGLTVGIFILFAIPEIFCLIIENYNRRKTVRLFNAFQITAAFVAWPFGVAWLANAEFRGSAAAFYASIVLYVVAFGCMVTSVYNSLSDLDGK